MAEPICEDEGLLQEWTPLTQLLQQIPLKCQKGLFPQNLNLTCIDVVPEFIVLGTNSGFVYWYCRANGELQRLRFENSHCSVTCVKVMLFVDYMLAAGTDQGTVIVFQIPKTYSGPNSEQSKTKNKQIERFTVNGIHQAPITCIEWNPNETKVFTGDKIGLVVQTEIDLGLHISKSVELLNEHFEIVQLSFSQQILLVSTMFRSVICDGSNNWKVRQVGSKERKILGKFGATFCHFQHGLVLYASRPGHRLWLSDKNGIVQQTLIFKSAVHSNCPRIQLINPLDKKEPYDTSFGRVVQFGDNKLITYNSEIMYILHPGAVSVISVLNNARKIIDLAVNENEIFILEGERSLIRIGSLPDKYSLEMQPVSRRTSFNLDEFAAKLKDTAVESIKKITKDLIPSTEQTSPNSPPALADEALELPPIVNLPPGSMPTIFTSQNIEIHSSVSNDQFFTSPTFLNDDICKKKDTSPFNQDCQEEVISRPLRKRHKKPKNLTNNLISESESDTTSNVSEDRLVWGIANDLSLSDESAISQSHSSFSVLRDISSILNQGEQTPGKNFVAGNEDLMKASDSKSQTSLDTCESVSERLLLTSEAFREEQERTFARLANQSLFDSFNSEKTDDMSISLNITNSSSVSSKISDNLHTSSYISEISGAASRPKSTESQSTDYCQNEMQKDYWQSNILEENSSQDEKVTSSETSSRNSQRERLYPRWSEEGEVESSALPKLSFEPDIKSNKDDAYHKAEFSQASFGKPPESEVIHSAQDFEPFMPSDSSISPEPENFLENEECTNESKEEKKENGLDAKSFLPNEHLSYGPPSGSSLLSSQPSSDFTSVQTSLQLQPLVRDIPDHWPQYNSPNKITSLAVSKNYVICTDRHKRVYYSPLNELALTWTLLTYQASLVRVSNDGTIVWFLKNKTVKALVDPSPNSPVSDVIADVAQDVKSFAIDSVKNDGLIVTSNGKIISYNQLLKNSSEEMKCNHVVIDVCCSNGIIVALTNDNSILLRSCDEDEFRIVKTLSATSSFALGPDNLLWVVDKENNIYFSDDFTNDNPHWWQIEISEYIFKNSPLSYLNINANRIKELKTDFRLKHSMVATSDNAVWIFNNLDSFVYVNKTCFIGYMWNKVLPVNSLPSIRWNLISAEGVIENKGRIWLLSSDGNIFCTSPDYKHFQSIPVPPDGGCISCLTSSAETLWVLAETGRIHSRLRLTSKSFSGVSWKEIKSFQIDNLRFIWISCGTDVAWAVDIHGRTFMTTGLEHHMPTLDPTWVEVEGRPKNVQFEKVFVGSQLYMVWAIDTKHNLYVREGIFPHYQIGTSWVYVCGIEAIHVTISGTQVWALASNGSIYRRCGVSESNYTGDYWKSIPGSLKMISSSLTDELWGIDFENQLVRLNYKSIILRCEKDCSKNKEVQSSKEDISWEIVE